MGTLKRLTILHLRPTEEGLEEGTRLPTLALEFSGSKGCSAMGSSTVLVSFALLAVVAVVLAIPAVHLSDGKLLYDLFRSPSTITI